MSAWLFLRCPTAGMLRLALAAILGAAPLAWAHEGHDHGADAAPRPAAYAPQRLPDGSVFLPKPSQRAMGVRTDVLQTARVPRTLELAGQVIMDPHLAGRVQPVVTGRIEADGPHGLPAAGSRVRKGQVLAWVVPSLGPIERANQAALLAELKAALELAERRRARLHELADTVARRDIEAADSEVQSLRGRLAAASQGIGRREALVAPLSGVLAASNAIIGQTVEPREVIFEIIDPDSLHIEVRAFEPLAFGEVTRASVQVRDQVVPLRFIGAPRRLREQALPLLFENHAAGAGLSLPLGQPVTVQVQLRASLEGLPAPQRALARNTANQPIVWVKTAAQRFEPRPVRFEALDGQRVVVLQGLAAGERIVIDGAGLIAQIR